MGILTDGAHDIVRPEDITIDDTMNREINQRLRHKFKQIAEIIRFGEGKYFPEIMESVAKEFER